MAGPHRFGRRAVQMRNGQAAIERLFAAADANKDGKLTKDEVANFFWSRLSKADVKHQNFVTKDDLKAYHKEQAKEMRAEHHEKAHKDHEKAHKAKDKKRAAQPAAKPAEQKEKPKADSKAEVTPSPKAPAKPESKAAVKVELKGISTPAAKAAVSERVKEPKAGTSAT
jgi:hypothetical protein